MAHKNPKPILFYEGADSTAQQEKPVAEYTLMKNVYFSFVDVLGFKQTFDENRRNPDDEFAKSFKESFQYFNLLMNGARFAGPGARWNAGQTSDSLYFYTDRIDYLSAFIKIYSHFSLYAMSKDVFLRGGIAKGDLYRDEPHQFYGDGVIKAYLLESSIAKCPRIVIDQNTYVDLEKDGSAMEFLTDKLPPHRNYIKPFACVSDGELQSFLNITPAAIYKITDDEWTGIGKNIQKNMTRFEFDDNNYRKYAFLQEKFEKSQNINK